MRRSYRSFLSSFLLVTLVAGGGLAGCGDIAESENDDGPREQEEDTDPPPQEGEIVHVEEPCPASVAGTNGEENPCYLQASLHNAATLKAKVLRSNGEPAGNRRVDFEVVDNEELLSLNSQRAVTEDEEGEELGIASVTVQTDSEMTGRGIVKASTPNEDLGAVFWEINVQSKGGGGYQVVVSYEGEANLGDAEVGIYPSDKSCEDLRTEWGISPDVERDGTPGNIVDDEQPLNPNSSGYERSFFFGDDFIDTGNSYTVWARAFKFREDGSDEPPVERAWGCADDNDTFEDDEQVNVEVELQDHLPSLRETYDVNHNFDLVDALPDNVERWVRLVGLFVRSPGAFLVGCKETDETVNRGGETVELCPNGEVDGMLDFLQDLDFLPDSLQDYAEQATENDAIRESVREIVDAYVVDRILEEVGWADAAANITDDIFSTITNFGVRGTMNFDQHPTLDQNDEGDRTLVFSEEETDQIWEEFSFYWSYGQNCEDSQDFSSCRTDWFEAQELLGTDEQFIQGNFEARLTGANSLHIDSHGMSINFGALVIGALEKVVLPRYFSDLGSGDRDPILNVDGECDGCAEDGDVTFQELLSGTLANCTEIVDGLEEENDQVDGGLESAVHGLCTDLQDTLVERFKGVIKDQLSIDEATLTLSLPGGDACELHEPDPYPGEPGANAKLPYIERLGTADAKCNWDAEISFASDPIDGEFYGDSQ